MNGIYPAVVSMSLGGPYSQALNEMVKYMVDAGFVVSAASANEAIDACYVSPASEPEVRKRKIYFKQDSQR